MLFYVTTLVDLLGTSMSLWMVASTICTLIYALTAWRLAGEFFDFATLGYLPPAGA